MSAGIKGSQIRDETVTAADPGPNSVGNSELASTAISSQTEKNPAVNGDSVLISDSADSGALKRVQIGNLGIGGGGGDSNMIEDADHDTKIQVEESADEDKIRFDTAGAERVIIDNAGNVGINISTPKTILDTHHNPTGLSNDTGGGEVVTFGTGNLTAGKIYFLNSSGAWTETDADAIPTSDGLLAIALGSAPSNGMLLRGFFDATTYLSNFISGLPVYLSATAATMDTTQPSGTGKIVRCIGYCTNTANVIYFNPSSTTVELS